MAGLAAAALGAAAGLLFGGAVRLRSMLALAVALSMLVTIGARQAQDLVPGNATVLDWSATLVVALAGWCSRAAPGLPRVAIPAGHTGSRNVGSDAHRGTRSGTGAASGHGVPDAHRLGGDRRRAGPAAGRFANGRSSGWGALCVLLGSAILLPPALQSRQHERHARQAVRTVAATR